jgi:hypothetical protein
VQPAGASSLKRRSRGFLIFLSNQVAAGNQANLAPPAKGAGPTIFLQSLRIDRIFRRIFAIGDN